jgi:hypothetical protein
MNSRAAVSDDIREALDQSRVHWEGGDAERALAYCRRALEIDPASAVALTNLGTLLWIGGDAESAEKHYLRAHALEPAHVGTILNIAALRNDAGDLDASMQWIQKAERLSPRNAEVIWRRSLIELALGDYRDGWEHYEAGLGHESLRGKGPGFTTAPWNGTPCDRLLLWHEQGFGDTMQFVRYAKLCKERASNVYVLCPKELVTLIRTCPFVDDAVESIGAADFDQQISIMSLPYLFGTTLDTIPASVPYLFADSARAAKWAIRMRTSKPKVGLVWSGNFRKTLLRASVIDRNRSVSLQLLEPWLDLDGIAFYSLQKGVPAKEAEGIKIVDLMEGVDDFAETAAIIENLDLVISVDTSVVHVAGAMGKPVWVLSRLDACWRWLRNRSDSPWYPTARVFGQAGKGDWSNVIASVRNELIAR